MSDLSNEMGLTPTRISAVVVESFYFSFYVRVMASQASSNMQFRSELCECGMYNSKIVQTYLCLHGICARPGCHWDGRHRSLTVQLSESPRHPSSNALWPANETQVRDKNVKLYEYCKSTSRTCASGDLLEHLDQRQLEPLGQAERNLLPPKAVDYIRKLLRDVDGVT